MTHAITAADIIPAEEYAKRRKELRAAVVALKRQRRLHVGPVATLHFENFETMWLQVQEMLRIEKGGADQIEGELETYNPLIPQGTELIATLMLEIEDPVRRANVLRQLGGIEESVFLDIGKEPKAIDLGTSGDLVRRRRSIASYRAALRRPVGE